MLRPVEQDDSQAIFEGYATDPVVSLYLTWCPHGGLSDTRAYIARCMEAPSSRTYAIIEREGSRLIGVFDLRRPNKHCVGFGYALAHQWWGQGLTTETLSTVADWALQQPSVWRIGDVCDVENLASARVMEKAGFEREGILLRWAIHPNLGPEPRNCISYARIR